MFFLNPSTGGVASGNNIPAEYTLEMADVSEVKAWRNANSAVVAAALSSLAPTLNEQKASLLADLASRRYELEVGGFDYMGARVMSDRESQSKIQGLMVGVQLMGDSFTTSWKCSGGQWLNLDKAGAIGLIAAALTHVSGLYSREAALAAQIEAASDLEGFQEATANFS